ncbi:MAG: gamma-glutamyltransferase [Siculibacillus sp.]|nr:gamma-glutamyltransferase [Siculibacillus sp.]
MIRTASRLLALAALLLAGPAGAASRPAVEGARGMVATANARATEVGVKILEAGGNAVDAAAAIGWALAVVDPCCGNIGGGGFMTLRLSDGREIFVDFRETAPAAATRDMYLDEAGNVLKDESLTGWRASGVPGTVAGLDHALARFGTMPRDRVMAPAITLARDGFILARADTDILERGTSRLSRDPEAARIFLAPDGRALKPGDRLVQPDLAATLAEIAASGPDAFYRGAIAEKVEAAMKARRGTLAAADFAAYRVNETAPVSCTYRGLRLISAPPPSSGGVTICLILNVLEGFDLKAMGWHSAAFVRTWVETLRHAYVDRNFLLGDPAFVKVPTVRLTSKDHAAAIRDRIRTDGRIESKSLAPGVAPHEKPETTHYSVVDAAGNAVAVTYTVNGLFGAAVVAPGTGFLLNDEMDDFTVKPGAANLFGLVQGEANAIRPGKRPLSSMSPTIVTKDGRLFLVLGSPGGSRIISTVAETIVDIVDFGMRPQEAADAPRIHHQWLPDKVYHEPFGLSADTQAILKGEGYVLEEQSPWGAVALIAVAPPEAPAAGPASSGNDAASSGALLSGRFYGAIDARRPAGAAASPP